MLTEDTIAAIATPNGVGAISIIRVSGEESLSSVDKIFYGKGKLVEAKSHTIHYGEIKDDGKIIDDVLVSIFKAPNSFTGENSAEISYHGNPLIGARIVEALLKQNVRLAEPGEFTKRAFLNNKMDLSQAEAVADIINSRTEASLKGARNQLDGILSAKVNSLREMLLNTCSFIEIELDFAEEDIEFIHKDEIRKRITNIIDEIYELLKTYSFGKVIRDGINVAIAGEPNVGKSSLLNLLLKESRAIVSNIPGTTRDVIREEVSIDGILFKLFDTAGIRKSEDLVEKEGMSRSIESVRNADVVLLLADTEREFPEELYNTILSHTPEERILKVLNKIDLRGEESGDGRYDVRISVLKGAGIEDLFVELKSRAFDNSGYSEGSAVVTNARHFNSLERAKEHLKGALTGLDSGLSGEFLSVDIRNGAASLGEIIGDFTSEDVLNHIFAKFCIGK